MKTKGGMEYEYKPGSPRLIDLGERLVPILTEWAQNNLFEGDRLDVLLMAGTDEVMHRVTVFWEKPTLTTKED